MKRQGLKVTLNELRNLIDELKEQNWTNDENQEFQINIINKTPKCSDTWEIEETLPKTAIKRGSEE